MRKNFIPRNDGFICQHCGQIVSPAPQTFRNHCPFCLTSKHVDLNIPGDRQSICQGLMTTTTYEGTDPDKLDLVQQCQKCGKINRNRTAPDDNRQVLYSR